MTASRRCLASTAAVVGISLAFAACGGAGTSAEPAPVWSGSSVTEDGVTTVVNESGSVWGGNASLVEEASIGALSGDDTYVFGAARAVTASDDRIFVIDGGARVVRAYDMSGAHVNDIGAPGDGPGEFRNPWAIGVVSGNRVFVRDTAQGRLHVFSPGGELLADWPAAGGTFTTIGDDGFAYVYGRLDTDADADRRRFAMIAVGPDGEGERIPLPVFETQRPLLPVPRRNLERGVVLAANQGVRFSVVDMPFAPNPRWALAANGTLAWSEADTYAFEVEHRDGGKLHVERTAASVPVDADEARWHQNRLSTYWRELTPDFVWDGDIPPTKRSLVALFPDRNGRWWVLRELAGVPLSDCDPNPEDFSGFMQRPCWRQPFALDGFGADGRYLGHIALPAEYDVSVAPFIRDDMMIAVVEDDAGTIMVKRYRIVPPGD